MVMQDGRTLKVRDVGDYFTKSQTLQNYHVGFGLYNLDEQEYVFKKNTHQFFTPASNTKLITLYAAMHYLDDDMPWMNVFEMDGKLIHQPVGDPSFLHPDLETEPRISNYFKNLSGDTVYLSLSHFKDVQYGSGWSWDDYRDYYHTEKSAFPIHSNLVKIKGEAIDPPWIPATVVVDESLGKDYDRPWDKNDFIVSSVVEEHDIPFHINEQVVEAYFTSQGKVLSMIDGALPEKPNTIIRSLKADSLFSVFMKKSDNHIGEQLLLQASQQNLGYMNTEDFIDLASNNLYVDINQEMRWVDGSGLSRYNSFTPNSMIYVLNAFVTDFSIERMKRILPAGGVEGSTLGSWYSFDKPRVFAKTGSLRHIHNLSGYVQAKSGTWYAFSFMNNSFTVPSSAVKQEMENVLSLVIERY